MGHGTDVAGMPVEEEVVEGSPGCNPPGTEGCDRRARPNYEPGVNCVRGWGCMLVNWQSFLRTSKRTPLWTPWGLGPLWQVKEWNTVLELGCLVYCFVTLQHWSPPGIRVGLKSMLPGTGNHSSPPHHLLTAIFLSPDLSSCFSAFVAVLPGVIGARNNGAGVVGVVPCIGLYSLRVMSKTSGLFSDVLRAYDWLVQNAVTYNIRVVNISLEGPVSELTEECNFLRRLTQLGVTVVAAAGGWGYGGRLECSWLLFHKVCLTGHTWGVQESFSPQVVNICWVGGGRLS